MLTIIKKVYQLCWGGLTYDTRVFFRFLYHLLIPTKPTLIQELRVDQVITAIKDGLSFIRLGDGEALILTGRDVYFQPTSRALAHELKTIINNYTIGSPYLLGIPTNKLPLTEAELTTTERRVWRLYRVLFSLRFPRTTPYAPLTFFYVGGRFKTLIEPIISNRHVICVSNSNVLDETFRSYASTKFARATFIETPAHDSFTTQADTLSRLDAVLVENSDLSPIILFAAGPASKAWAYQYTKRGIQCLDIGHGMQLIAHDGDRSDQI